MRKQVFKGWIRKDERYVLDWLGKGLSKELGTMTQIYALRGNPNAWDDVDWPPRKVTVTVEVEDGVD